MCIDNENGILIFATGHHQYIRMAYNLAVTIKAVENFPIAVVGTNFDHLTDKQKEVFDYLIPADLPANCGAKLHAYQYTPFERTLLLDADMLWMPDKKPSELFNDLDCEFTCIWEGNSDDVCDQYFFWAELEEIRRVYNVGKVYQLRTEVMFFVKNKRIEAMFQDAIKIFNLPGLKYKKFGDSVPDELAMNIAAAIHQIEPCTPKGEHYAYWPRLHKDTMIHPAELYRNYYLLSCGGCSVFGELQKFYNNFMRAQCRKIGHQHIFSLQSKYTFIPERVKG